MYKVLPAETQSPIQDSVDLGAIKPVLTILLEDPSSSHLKAAVMRLELSPLPQARLYESCVDN